jgi:hypothetical protein
MYFAYLNIHKVITLPIELGIAKNTWTYEERNQGAINHPFHQVGHEASSVQAFAVAFGSLLDQ